MHKLLSFVAILTAFNAFAQQKNAKYEITVNGVCNSCKVRIEKASLGVKGVKFAKWDVQTHQLILVLDERKTSIDDIQNTIASVGHDNTNPQNQKTIIAPTEKYNNVSDCCKYRDEEVVKNHPKH